MTTPLQYTEMPALELINRGKVRDIYSVDNSRLLIVATDRISAFDVVLPNAIPDKGRVLTQISLFWLERLRDLARNHLITAIVDAYPRTVKVYRDQLEGRSMLVRRLGIVPIECVVRGYLAGSGWREYQQSGTVCGIKLPAGLRESEELPQPIFTPATKAVEGHDQNISLADAVALVGASVANRLAETSLALYNAAADYARSRGIIIADTKFEFGLDESGNLVLADEVLTPDSSRFWDAQTYQPGRPQDSFDKQYVRDYLESLDWKKEPPGPTLPDEIVAGTRRRYLEAHDRLTAKPLTMDGGQ